jgi:hypothetical protein
MLKHRKLDEIIPANYSASYESVVQHLFTDDTAARTYTLLNATEESEKHYDGVSDLLTRVNMTRDSMDEDEDYFSMNLTAVGCILLKFTNDFSKEMVSMKSFHRVSYSLRDVLSRILMIFCFAPIIEKGWDEIVSQTVLNNPELPYWEIYGRSYDETRKFPYVGS